MVTHEQSTILDVNCMRNWETLTKQINVTLLEIIENQDEIQALNADWKWNNVCIFVVLRKCKVTILLCI